MPEVTMRHEIECSEDTFWNHAFFEEDYNRRLYLDELRFPGFEFLGSTDQGDKRTRKVKLDPPLVGLPGPVTKLVKNGLSYIEEGTFDKKTKRFRANVSPSVLPEKTTIWGELWCESLGEKRIARFVKVHVEVKVFMIGGLIEEKVIGDLKQSYSVAADFTTRYVKEKGL